MCDEPLGLRSRRVIAECVKLGLIERPIKCDLCNKEAKKIIGHHLNYLFPFDVLWLCTSCHRRIHLGHRILSDKEKQLAVDNRNVIVRNMIGAFIFKRTNEIYHENWRVLSGRNRLLLPIVATMENSIIVMCQYCSHIWIYDPRETLLCPNCHKGNQWIDRQFAVADYQI
jgi:hypothetical protein